MADTLREDTHNTDVSSPKPTLTQTDWATHTYTPAETLSPHPNYSTHTYERCMYTKHAFTHRPTVYRDICTQVCAHTCMHSHTCTAKAHTDSRMRRNIHMGTRTQQTCGHTHTQMDMGTHSDTRVHGHTEVCTYAASACGHTHVHTLIQGYTERHTHRAGCVHSTPMHVRMAHRRRHIPHTCMCTRHTYTTNTPLGMAHSHTQTLADIRVHTDAPVGPCSPRHALAGGHRPTPARTLQRSSKAPLPGRAPTPTHSSLRGLWPAGWTGAREWGLSKSRRPDGDAPGWGEEEAG